jgi:hypothetical protein
LAHGGVDYGPEQRVVHFERLSKMVLNMQGDYPGQQDCAERFMTFPKVAIAEPMDRSLRLKPSARTRAKMNRPIGYVSSPKRG